MRTLGRFADGVLEAGWLTAVVLVPLFIDKDSAQAFEPAKAGLLMAIALLMLVAWATKVLCSSDAHATPTAPSARLRALVRAPLVLPVASLLVFSLLSTVCSLSPAESLWGHHGRALGVLTLLAELCIFAATAANLSSPRQLRRLLTGLILPSIPIALYALCQRLQRDPLLLTSDTDVQRATSFFGQPVYLAAYLVMVIPFTALYAIEAVRERAGSRTQRLSRAGVYTLLLLVQGVALLCSESRGPVLGLGVAALLAVLAVAGQRGWRRGVLLLWALVGTATVLVALGLPARLAHVSSSGEEARVALRAAETFSVSGGGGQFRTTSWNVAARVLANRVPLELSDGSHDPHPGLRRALGYGPELQYAIAPPFYDSELPRLFGYFLIDRFHNQLWDTLLTTGLLGLMAWLAVEAALLWSIVHGLGLLDTRAHKRLFWGALSLGALPGALGWSVARGLPFCFLGLQTGALLGLGLFLSIRAWRPRAAHEPPATSELGARAEAPRASRALPEGVAIAALAAIAGHLIETSFSFATLSTAALFWVVCALVWVCARAPHDPALASDAQGSGEALRDAALLAWPLVAIGFTFLGAASAPLRTGSVLWDGLTLLSRPAGERAPVVVLLVLGTLLLGALLLRFDRPIATPAGQTWLAVAVAAGLALVFWLQRAAGLAERARATLGTAAQLTANLESRAGATTTFYLSSLLLALLFAAASARSRERIPHTQRALPWWRPALSAACLLLALFGIERASLRPAHAEVAIALGEALKAHNRWALAEQALEYASALVPSDDVYRATLAKAYSKHARAEASHAASWLARAEQTMREAIALNPAAIENATNLAVIVGQRAQLTGPAQRMTMRPLVIELYARALRLHPLDPNLWRMWGNVQLSLLADGAGALASAQHALPLDPKNAAGYALLGEARLTLARGQNGELRAETTLAAARDYEQAAGLSPGQASYRVNSGRAYLAVGQADKAAAAFRVALSRLPPANARERAATLALLQRAQAAVSLTSAPASTP